MKRVLAMLLCMILFLGILPHSAMAALEGNVASGQCGAAAFWSLDDRGCLTISGSGPMDSFAWGVALRDRILTVAIEAGITELSSLAFDRCTRLTAVYFHGNAPKIAPDCFGGRGVVCFYPAGDNTWSALTSEALTFVMQPATVLCAPGETVKLTTAASSNDVKFQWFYSTNQGKDWSESGMAGCKTPTLTIPVTASRMGQLYRCRITLPDGTSAVSEPAALERKPIVSPLQILHQPEDCYARLGELCTLKVSAQGDGLTYRWYYSTDHGRYWMASGMAGSNTDTMSIPLTQSRIGQMYRCEIRDASGSVLTTRDVTLLLAEEPKEVPSIQQEPADFMGSVGDTAVFHVIASGEGLTYQWYYSTDGGRYWSQSGASGSKTATLRLELTTARTGQQYRCVIIGTDGTTLQTRTVSMSIDPANANFRIVTQPQDGKAKLGDQVAFIVKAEGNGLTYQWYFSSDQGKYWSKSGSSDSNTNTLTVTVSKGRVGYMYRCEVKNAAGTILTTRGATLSAVTETSTLRITKQPVDYTTVPGQNAAFHVEAKGSDLQYQWYYSPDKGINWSKSGMTGCKTDTLTVNMTAARAGQMYRCEITDSLGTTLTSAAATLIRGVGPVVSFVDDDGTAGEYRVLYPWAKANKVPYCFAIPVGSIGKPTTQNGQRKYCTWEELQEMSKSDLISFSCHCVGDDVMTNYTAEEMEAILNTWLREMDAHGLLPESEKKPTYMYCHGSYDDEIIDQVVSKMFRAGFTVRKGINSAPFDSFHLRRAGLFPTSDSYTIEDAKAAVDQLCHSGGWLVFFTHCYYESFNLEELTELVNYIRSKGVEIAGIDDVLDRFG